MPDLNPETIDRLVEAASEVRDKAHAPYSTFTVGAAVVDEDGQSMLAATSKTPPTVSAFAPNGTRWQQRYPQALTASRALPWSPIPDRRPRRAALAARYWSNSATFP